jgi:AcrR family transcriptional regulator
MSSKQRLIEATAQLVWERGIEATSPAAILAASGVGHGSLYHHFSGKPELIDAAVATLAAQLREDNDAVLSDETAPAIERVRGYLAKQREPLRGCRLGRLAFDPALEGAVAGTLRRAFAELEEKLAELISAAQADGELATELQPEDTAAAIVATVQGGYVLSAATADPGAMDRALAGAAALLTK